MSRRQKHPLRALTDDERLWLTKIARSKREPSSHVARAKQLLAVSDGYSYTAAAKASGRKSGDAVAQLVERFNREVCQQSNRRRAVDQSPSMVFENVRASWQKSDVLQTLSRMARRRGR